MDARFSRALAPDTAWSTSSTIAPAFAQEMIYQSFREVEVEVTDDGHAHLWFVRIGSFGRTLERSAQRLDQPQLEELVGKLRSSFGLSLTPGAHRRLVLRRQEQPEPDPIW
jgi:hypothetical protein